MNKEEFENYELFQKNVRNDIGSYSLRENSLDYGFISKLDIDKNNKTIMGIFIETTKNNSNLKTFYLSDYFKPNENFYIYDESNYNKFLNDIKKYILSNIF